MKHSPVAASFRFVFPCALLIVACFGLFNTAFASGNGIGSPGCNGCPGGLSYSPFIDVVRQITLEPSPRANTALVNTQICFFVSVRDYIFSAESTSDIAVPNIRVQFKVRGANPGNFETTAGSFGNANFCYRGINQGADTIVATAVGSIGDSISFLWTTTPVANDFYSKPAGDLHDLLTWGVNPDGSGANPPLFGLGKAFHLANRAPIYNMTGNWSLEGLIEIPAGSQLRINGFTLSQAGLRGQGTLFGSPTSNLALTGIGSSAGALIFASGGQSLNNLTINRRGGGFASTTVISPLDIYGVLSVVNGNFSADASVGGQLTLKSNISNTARVAPVGDAISGDVIVERFIPARRAWRLLSAPVASLNFGPGNQSINAAWQEGVTTSSPNPNPNPGFGTHITQGSPGTGFDFNPAGGSTSIKRYVSTSDTWVPLTNTSSTAVNSAAFMLFVRGNRGIPLGDNSVAPASTVLRARGRIKYGDQDFAVSGTGFTAIPNPYASPIDFSTIVKNGVQNNCYLWDPQMGGEFGVGAYVLLSFNGSTYDVVPAPVSPMSQYIESGQGFLVRASTPGVAGTLTIREQDKSATPARNVFRVTEDYQENLSGNGQLAPVNSGQGLRVNLQVVNPDNTTSLLDEVLSSYKKDYSDKLDDMDAIKATNIGENLAIVREGESLMIDRKTVPALSGETIELKLWNASVRNYVLEFNPVNLQATGLSATLEDSYTNSSTPVNLSVISRIPFSVTVDAASQVADRFRIVFTRNESTPVINPVKRSIIAFPNPVNGRTINFQFHDQPQGSYNIALHDITGRLLHRGEIKHTGGSATKSIQLTSKLTTGTYQMVITNKEANIKTTIQLLSN